MSENRQNQTARGTVMLTPDEKADALLVAAFDRLTESEVLRAGVDVFCARAALIRSGEAQSRAA